MITWDGITTELRGYIIPFAKNKARATKLYYENLEKQLAELELFKPYWLPDGFIVSKQSELEK